MQEITNEKFDYDDFDLVMIWFEKYSEQLEMPRESDIVNLSTQYKSQAVFLSEESITWTLSVTNYFSIWTADELAHKSKNEGSNG